MQKKIHCTEKNSFSKKLLRLTNIVSMQFDIELNTNASNISKIVKGFV